MFLKMMSTVPDLIFAADSSGITVNLFISSVAEIAANKGNKVKFIQETNYPWDGNDDCCGSR